MSFIVNPAQQLMLDDSTFHLTKRERKALEKSWAKVFADDLFPKIDEEPFHVLYCADNGRPNTPVNRCKRNLYTTKLERKYYRRDYHTLLSMFGST